MRLSKTVLATLGIAMLVGAGAFAWEVARPRVHPIKEADARKYGLGGEPAEAPAPAPTSAPAAGDDPADQRTDLFGPARALDGDTLVIDGVEADLWTIDAPDLGKTCERDGSSWACGEASRANLERLIGGRMVACRPEGPPPRDGRWLGLCFVSASPCAAAEDNCASDLTSLNIAQVRQGWALDTEGQYAEPESDAREAKAGLWAGGYEIPTAYRE